MTIKNKDFKQEIKPAINLMGGLFLSTVLIGMFSIEISDDAFVVIGGLELVAVVWAMVLVNRK